MANKLEEARETLLETAREYARAGTAYWHANLLQAARDFAAAEAELRAGGLAQKEERVQESESDESGVSRRSPPEEERGNESAV
jgi:hypothetical protein